MLDLKAGEQYSENFEEWIRIIQDTRTHICTPYATAAEHLLWEAISERYIDPELTSTEVTSDQLLQWIGRQGEHGVISCDVGIAYRLMAAGKFKNLDLRMSFVPYDEPVPVGIAFSKHDPLWGRFLELVVYEVLNSQNEHIAKSVADTKERFRELYLEWAYPQAA